MKYTIILLTLVTLVAFAPQKKTKVIFFGDSITELGVKDKPYKGYVLLVDSLAKTENKGDQFEFSGAGGER